MKYRLRLRNEYSTPAFFLISKVFDSYAEAVKYAKEAYPLEYHIEQEGDNNA